MPMYTHDRSRRRKGVNVAEIVAGVLGVILLILLIGAFSSQTPRRRDDRRVPKNRTRRSSPISFYTLTPLLPRAVNRSLSSARVTLTRQLEEHSVRERTSENKWKTSSRSKDGKIAELEKMIETLRAEKDAHHGSRSECDEKLAEAEGAQRAEAIRSERIKSKLDSARAAEHNQKMALGKCEQALERALQSAGQSDADAHRFSESVAAVADDDDDDWDEDLITDIVHPTSRYDRVPREGTSHHLAADEAEMHGLEDDAAAAMDAEEKLLTNARDPAMEYPDDLTDAEPEPEPVPPKKRKVEIEKKSKSKSPPPQKYKKPPAPPPARARNGRKLPPGKAPPATASELRRNRQKARQSLFASAEM